MKTLNAILFCDRKGMPMVQIDSPLGNGMECSPAGLRELAKALNAIADHAAAVPQVKPGKNLHGCFEEIWHPFA
jgi:hypothetical protein